MLFAHRGSRPWAVQWGGCLVSAWLLVTPLAHAEGRSPPSFQWSAGLLLGGAITDLRAGDLRSETKGAFFLGVRGDVLFFRDKDSAVGFGPYLDVTTVRFDSLQAGGGVSVLLPAWASLPFVLSGGMFARASEKGWEPGASAQVFFGPRSYNFHSTYGMTNGIFVDGRLGLGDSRQAELLIGFRVDGEILGLPILLPIMGARGSR